MGLFFKKNSNYLIAIFVYSIVLLGTVSCGMGLFTGGGAPGVSGASSVANADGTITVTISGSGFVNGMTVSVNGTPCTNVVVVSAAQLTCMLPDSSISLVNIIVTLPGGASSGSGLTSPLISSTATAATDGGGANPWLNVSDALTNNGLYAATNNPGPGAFSNKLILKGYFSNSAQALSATATVTGIKANCYWKNSGGLGASITLGWIGLIYGATQSNNKSGAEHIPNTWATSIDYGGSSDAWGLSLTPAMVNSADFGLSLSIDSGTIRNVYVDYCTLYLYFQ